MRGLVPGAGVPDKRYEVKILGCAVHYTPGAQICGKKFLP